jgi:hypothetical protein
MLSKYAYILDINAIAFLILVQLIVGKIILK